MGVETCDTRVGLRLSLFSFRGEPEATHTHISIQPDNGDIPKRISPTYTFGILVALPALAMTATPDVPVSNLHNEARLQTVPVLEAIPNPTTPTPYAIGGADISIVSDSALMSESGPAGTIADIAPTERTGNQISTYIVREGDTLSQIADMFGVTPNTIRWANDLGGQAITPGQTLAILPIPGVQHEIKSGDSIKSIAKKYNGDVDEIRDYNNITDETLVVGAIITVPYGEIAAPKVTKPSSGSSAPAASSPSYAGYYMRPLSGGTRTQGIHGYNAIDLASYVGAPVYAAAAGEVMIARTGWNGGYGNYVVIKHDNGTQTLYAHLSSVTVSAGQWVSQGAHIGGLGNTGRSTGPHLHFEIRGASNPF